MTDNNVHCDPAKRHEFVLLFDVRNGNPNGDPDAGNLPRVDPETMHGLVTDVALKRKIRDYITSVSKLAIFIQSQQALNSLILQAFQKAGVEPIHIDLSQDDQENEKLIIWLEGKMDAGFLVEEGKLLYSGEAQKPKEITQLLLEGIEEEENDLTKRLQKIAKSLANAVKNKGKVITRETREKAREQLCSKYFDIRMFGAVLSTGLNAGQVRGPVQLTFGHSIDPIQSLDLSITRVAITRKEDRKRKETEMGRKAIVPYGLYRAHGFYNPFLAEQTGVSQDDLERFWEALVNMFEFDRSAARGEMAVRGLWVFSHENAKGNAPAHRLFDTIQVRLKDGVEAPREFSDYNVVAPVDEINEPFDMAVDPYKLAGITLTRLA